MQARYYFYFDNYQRLNVNAGINYESIFLITKHTKEEKPSDEEMSKKHQFSVSKAVQFGKTIVMNSDRILWIRDSSLLGRIFLINWI